MGKRIWVVLVILAILLVGCSSAGPGKTVEKFFTAVEDGEIEEAMSYLSSSTVQLLGAEKWQAALIEGSQEMASEGGIKSIETFDENIHGDIATVSMTLTMADGSQETETIDLIKEDGDWKIRLDLTK